MSSETSRKATFEVFRVTGYRLTWMVLPLPTVAFILCVSMSIINNYEAATRTHCGVRNVQLSPFRGLPRLVTRYWLSWLLELLFSEGWGYKIELRDNQLNDSILFLTFILCVFLTTAGV